MNIGDKIAAFISGIATGNAVRRLLVTPLVLLLFIIYITGFMLLGYWLDIVLNLPRPNGWWMIAISVVLLIPGVLVLGWTFLQFLKNRGTPVPVNPPKKLITYGLYNYVRNPMALGVFLVLEGAAFLVGSIMQIIIFAPLPVLLYLLFIKTVEEKELEMRFGDDYRNYRKKVPVLIPSFRKYTGI